MSSPQKRAKAWGYSVEVAALKALTPIFPNLRRTGSVAYKKAAADLVQDGTKSALAPIRLVVTRDKRRPLLVTLSVSDLVALLSEAGDKMQTLGSREISTFPVVVQVKGRARSWIGTLYDALCEATR